MNGFIIGIPLQLSLEMATRSIPSKRIGANTDAVTRADNGAPRTNVDSIASIASGQVAISRSGRETECDVATSTVIAGGSWALAVATDSDRCKARIINREVFPAKRVGAENGNIGVIPKRSCHPHRPPSGSKHVSRISPSSTDYPPAGVFRVAVVTATPKGKPPTGIVAVTVLVAVLITETLLSRRFVM
jgi:hypothetical protein